MVTTHAVHAYAFLQKQTRCTFRSTDLTSVIQKPLYLSNAEKLNMLREVQKTK